MRLYVETDDALPHCTQVNYVANAGEVIVRAKMFVLYYIMIRSNFLVSQC